MAVLVACCAILISGCESSSRNARSAAPERVFFIVVDTLRADRLGVYGYPRATSPVLDPLAREGVVFERAIAQWPKTGASMASLFTGRYPQTTGMTHKAAIDLPQDYETIPELFKRNGYTTLAVIGNAVLSSDTGWAQGFDEFIEPWKLVEERPETPLDWRRVLNAKRINEHAIRLMEQRADDPKLFLWLHYLDPHAPYTLPEGVENPFLADEYYDGETQIGRWFPEREMIDKRRDLGFYLAQYDANVRVVDQAVGEILERAGQLGLLDNALVVFLSDHGEGLGDHKELKHGRLPYNSTAQVPLVFWFPGGIDGGRRVSQPVELVDLYPTFRDLISPEQIIEGLEGDSLIDFLRLSGEEDPETSRPAFSEAGEGNAPWIHYRSIQDDRWKLVYHPERTSRDQPVIWQLFDLERDPGETEDLVQRERREAARLKAELFDWMRDPAELRQVESEGENQSEEMLEALRALGYLN